MKCTAGYWIKTDEGFLKNQNEELEVINETEAKIGRARYVLNFQEEITERKIQKEVEDLKKLTKEAVESYLSKIKNILMLAGVINESILFVLQKRLWEENGTLEERIAEAKEIAMQKSYIYSYEKTKEMYENEDYNSLYIYFFQDGLPEIACFNNNDVEGLKKHFHKDKINETIDDIKNHDHLYNVAKFNIEKKRQK